MAFPIYNSHYDSADVHLLQVNSIKFAATLDVRLPNMRVLLVPVKGIYEPNTAQLL